MLRGLSVVCLAGLAGVTTTLMGCSGVSPVPQPVPVEPAKPAAPEPVADPRPNVLIVVWDTVRADRMSLYGYGRPTTPKLAAWAQDAVVFEHATAPGMWTLPSHASMFTGLHESEHGAKPSWRWLDGRFDTLAELLGGAGYGTFAFSSNLIASPMTNLTQGFETVLTSYPREGASKLPHIRAARQATAAKLIPSDASTEISPAFAGSKEDKWGKAVHKDAAPVLHQGLVRWVDEQPVGKPWFAYLNMMEAHTPRIPSMSARKRVLTEEQIQAGLTTDASLFAENEYIVGMRSYTAKELDAIGGVYDAALVDLDDATSALFADLTQRGILDNTLVVVVADHGEALGEHQRLEHRWSVYEQLLSVPLVVRYPKGFDAAAAKPQRVEARVSTADVFATVLDVTGTQAKSVPKNSVSLASRVAKNDFAPQVFAQMLDPFATQLKSMSRAYPKLDLSVWTRTYCAVYEGTKKLIYASDGAHELYDLHLDPGELKNLNAAELATSGQLAESIGSWEAGLVTYDPSLRAKTDGARGQRGGRGGGATREECQQLVMLGYVDSMEDCLTNEPETTIAKGRCGPALKPVLKPTPAVPAPEAPEDGK